MDNHIVRALECTVTDEVVSVVLSDGRIIAAPLVWYPRLHQATPQQRSIYRLIGGGRGIHWPECDEDLSVEGILAGMPTRERGVHV